LLFYCLLLILQPLQPYGCKNIFFYGRNFTDFTAKKIGIIKDTTIDVQMSLSGTGTNASEGKSQHQQHVFKNIFM